MFKKPFRSKLYKHSWLEVAEEDTNTSQTWGRIKDSLKEDLADMVLLYKKLPKEKRDQLYTQENFRDVLNLLLEHEKCDDSIKLGIAAFLVELFPTKIRYTSMSLPYHIGNGVFGGLTPFIATLLTTIYTGDKLVGLYYPIIIAVVCLVIGTIYISNKIDPNVNN